ncbi:hypothetical protein KIW84_054801 [Lathyrus oleraceus]|uniref:Uncharacterized protein n=1 Tax=Pisum sativum TaxID=3888 RepID=A0A9D5AHX5_PEA|nr:hypothetical protein KIW84_054801 [Pisum sativum]
MRGWNIFWSLVVDWIKLPIIEREIRSDSKSEFELVLTPKPLPLPTSDELQVKIESPENLMKMRFALAGSCRREDIPACGRVPFFNIRNGDLGPTLFLIFKVLLLQQRAVAKSGVHVSQREELWSSLSLYFKTDFEFERGGRDDKGIGQRHLSSHRRSGPNLIKGCLALPKGEESLGTDSLTSPPAADRTRASIYSTALTVTEKTGTGCSYSSERGIFAFLLATRIGKVSVVIGAGEEMFWWMQDLGPPEIVCKMSLQECQSTEPPGLRIGGIPGSSGRESLIKKKILERLFIDLVAGESLIKSEQPPVAPGASACYLRIAPWISSEMFDASWGFFGDREVTG